MDQLFPSTPSISYSEKGIRCSLNLIQDIPGSLKLLKLSSQSLPEILTDS